MTSLSADLQVKYKRAAELLDVIAAEFASDPDSVQCFDLRIVQESIEIPREIRALEDAQR